jgi:hypothetical protein
MATRRDVCPQGSGLARKGKPVTDNNINTNGLKLKSPAPQPDPDVANPDTDHVDDLAEASDATPSDEAVDAQADADSDEGAAEAPTDPDHDEASDKEDSAKSKDRGGRASRRVSISFSARSLLYGTVIAALVGALATFVWLYIDAQRELDAQARKSDNNAHAEKVALDYAVNAAAMNFQDINGWKAKLVAGTSPELNNKLTKAAESMQQILIPLQWTSTAQPLVAKVRSNNGGIYVVDCFVSVLTKTVQAPEPLRSTATYSLTLDSNKNWQIADVGGIGALTDQK